MSPSTLGSIAIPQAGGMYDAYAYLRDEKAAGTAGGVVTTGSFQTRTLNTEVHDPGGIVSLAANQFTLQPGTYLIRARVPFFRTQQTKVKLRNVTAGSDVAIGTNGYGTQDSFLLHVEARVAISVATAFEIQYRATTTDGSNANTSGIPANFAVAEVYTEVEIWREGVVTPGAVAGSVVIEDTGGYFTATSVETALQELGAAIPWTVVKKLADESVASSTATQNDDELFFQTVNAAVYEIEGVLYYVSTAGGGTPDLKTDWGEDATARGSIYIPGHSNTDANFTGAADTNQTATIILGTAATPRLVKFMGGHVGAGGVFRLRWAQNASGSNATVVKAGSVLRYRRLA